MRYEKLFNHMSEEHNVTLLETDMQEICNIVNEIQNEAPRQPPVIGSVCPKCGYTDYEEWEELEYENGGDDPMYGGALVPMKFTRCGQCD